MTSACLRTGRIRFPPKRKLVFGWHSGLANGLSLLFSAVLFCLVGCQSDEVAVEESPIKSNRVVTTSFALKSLVDELVAGTPVSVECPMADAPNPRDWSPSVDEVIAMGEADLIISNGLSAPYAKWMARVTIDTSKLCNSVGDFSSSDFLKVTDYQVTHSHGPEGEHSHPYFVAYPWTDPSLAIKQAERICARLSATYAEFASTLRANLAKFKSKLQPILDSKPEFDQKLNVICLNPSMKFLTRWLGLVDNHLLFFTVNDIADSASFNQQLEKATNAADDGAKNILAVNYELPADVAASVVKTGVEIVMLDVMDRDHGKDFVTTLKSNIELLKLAGASN